MAPGKCVAPDTGLLTRQSEIAPFVAGQGCVAFAKVPAFTEREVAKSGIRENGAEDNEKQTDCRRQLQPASDLGHIPSRLLSLA
jgi:hypothetical protein